MVCLKKSEKSWNTQSVLKEKKKSKKSGLQKLYGIRFGMECPVYKTRMKYSNVLY